MAPFRTGSLTLVLLLALVLPLQSFAAAWDCGAHDAGAAAPHHCAGETGKTRGGELHHHCGTCCAAAIAVMPYSWTAPRSASSEAFLPLHTRSPSVAPDRLDRPPRPIR